MGQKGSQECYAFPWVTPGIVIYSHQAHPHTKPNGPRCTKIWENRPSAPTPLKLTNRMWFSVVAILNTDSDLKVHALHYANELLVPVRLSFPKLLQTGLICRNIQKNAWEKSNDACSLSSRVHTTKNHISICFYRNINVKEIGFFQSAS